MSHEHLAPSRMPAELRTAIIDGGFDFGPDCGPAVMGPCLDAHGAPVYLLNWGNLTLEEAIALERRLANLPGIRGDSAQTTGSYGEQLQWPYPRPHHRAFGVRASWQRPDSDSRSG